ncbi:MAG: SDR family NAD(P)-dependent oxidoreductase [Mariprofundaceae bacterium]
MDKQSNKRIIAVSGASSGLGQALCVALGSEGVNIIALARDEAGLEQTQARVEEAGGRCLCLPFDLLDFDQYPAMYQALSEHIPHLDGLVHAAADLKRCAPMQHVKPAEFRRMLDINLAAPNLLTQTLFPFLLRASSSSVIFTACDMAEDAQANWHGYGMAKAGLVHSAALWQLEHPSRDIRFNCLNPGRMRTRILKRAYPGLDENTIPKAETACAAFLYLLSDKSGDIRGKYLNASELNDEINSP